MAKSSSVYTRVEPALKEQVEYVLSQLGIPMANAINLFLHQIVLHNGIPFDVKVPVKKPLNYSKMTPDQVDVELEKGYADSLTGRMLTSQQVKDSLRKRYNK